MSAASPAKKQKLAADAPAVLPNVHDADTSAVAPGLCAIQRADYTPSPYLIPSMDLAFQLPAAEAAAGDALTVVTSRLSMTRASPTAVDLVMNAEMLQLDAISLNGRELTETEYVYDSEAEKLTVFAATLATVGSDFLLATTVSIDPARNLQFQGLYLSSMMFCTQCEAEGFRRIMPSLDRPDVLSRYVS